MTLVLKGYKMLEWIPDGLPQTKGYWLWGEADSPQSYMVDEVYIHELNDYKPQSRENIVNKKAPEGQVYLYKNDAGVEIVICWSWSKGSITKPSFLKSGIPACDWAPFNFPGNTRKFDPIIPKLLPTKES